MIWQRVAHPHWEEVLRDLVDAPCGRDHQPLRRARCCTTGTATLPHFWQVVPKEFIKHLPVPLREVEEEVRRA